MKREDYVGPPCYCPQCTQAGMAGTETQRDPHTGKWLHGYPLKRLHEAAEKLKQEIRGLAAKKVTR